MAKNIATAVDELRLCWAEVCISRLAEGRNPITCEPLPDSDIVNDEKVSKCLSYVSGLLDDISAQKSSKKSEYDYDFKLTEEQAEEIPIVNSTGITAFVKSINSIIPERMKPLKVTDVTKWLVQEGYLDEIEKESGRKYKEPTDLGFSMGITSEWRQNRDGIFYRGISYDREAQIFLLERIVEGLYLKEDNELYKLFF